MNIGCASGIWMGGKRVSAAAIAACMLGAGVTGCATTRHHSSSTPALPTQGCAVQAQAEVMLETSADGARAWAVIFSAETNAELEGVQVFDSDGVPHQNALALDCLVDEIVQARELCIGAWQHDADVATELPDGRLLTRIYCVNKQRV